MDVDEFLKWVLTEHGTEVRDRVAARLASGNAQEPDAGAVVRQVLIELYPQDFEYQPETDLLPYGFCSD